jgi:hypothetical protein
MFMTSPTHAFSIFPGEPMIRKGWEEKLFTYTWVRDEVILPGVRFYEKIRLTAEEQTYLMEKFTEELPLLLAHEIQQTFQAKKKAISIKEFRNYLLALFPKKNGELSADLDGFLYKMLPLIPGNEWKHYVELLLGKSIGEELDSYSNQIGRFVSAFTLRNIATGCLILLEQSICFDRDLHREVMRSAEKWGLAPPAPVIFADTNWPCNYFAFAVNPGTMELELWRMDRSKGISKPMTIWKDWLNGTHRDPWLLYFRPYEYRLV